ncbi:hypothetical protein MAR_001341 [Mya arenaria]|uniref:Uncharacterized protein n=1 Tax=Mya arenaria TaxID=6604 RepID=A0ABY7FBF9_MYAAR|nr:hypothetical protein MAR_001341 [Mya arenaria]
MWAVNMFSQLDLDLNEFNKSAAEREKLFLSVPASVPTPSPSPPPSSSSWAPLTPSTTAITAILLTTSPTALVTTTSSLVTTTTSLVATALETCITLAKMACDLKLFFGQTLNLKLTIIFTKKGDNLPPWNPPVADWGRPYPPPPWFQLPPIVSPRLLSQPPCTLPPRPPESKPPPRPPRPPRLWPWGASCLFMKDGISGGGGSSSQARPPRCKKGSFSEICDPKAQVETGYEHCQFAEKLESIDVGRRFWEPKSNQHQFHVLRSITLILTNHLDLS